MPISIEQDRILKTNTAYGQLLTAAVAVTNGTWVEIKGIHGLTITIEGTYTATATVNVSNAVAPLSTEAGVVIDTTTNTPLRTTIDSNIRWVKVAVTAYTNGTINAYCFAAA